MAALYYRATQFHMQVHNHDLAQSNAAHATAIQFVSYKRKTSMKDSVRQCMAGRLYLLHGSVKVVL